MRDDRNYRHKSYSEYRDDHYTKQLVGMAFTATSLVRKRIEVCAPELEGDTLDKIKRLVY